MYDLFIHVFNNTERRRTNITNGGDRIMGMLDLTDEVIRSALPGGHIDCPECGKRIDADETECPECGAEL